jgi:uncharacterized protein YndB with AHSA1/START domain
VLGAPGLGAPGTLDGVRVLAETTVDADAPPEAVWDVWADVAGRPRWHPGLEWARTEGPLAVGARLSWKPERARPVALVVAELEPGRRLVLVGTHGPPVARGHYLHEVVARPGGGSRLTHRMALSGPLAAPIAALFGRPLGVFGTPVAARAVAGVAAAR